MSGQGSPPVRCVGNRRRTRSRWRVIRTSQWWWVLCCALSVTLLSPAAPAQGQPSELHLRVTWGGGAPQRWEGRLHIDNGELSDLRYLGLDADESATIYLDPKSAARKSQDAIDERRFDDVVIKQTAPSDLDGFDVRVRGDLASRLQFELAPVVANAEKSTATITLSELVAGYHHRDLDNQGNKLLVQRVSGDALRVHLDRPALVFAPNEPFEFRIQPYLMGVEPDAVLRYRVQLRPARGDTTLWEQEFESAIATDGSGEFVGPVSLTVPGTEGVYDVVISAFRKKTLRNSLMWSKPIYERRIQFIVLAPEPTAQVMRDWELVDTIEPSSARWKEWLARVPKLPLLPGFRQEPLRSSKTTTLRHLDQDLVQLAPGDWEACPLPVEKAGRPHVLEVEYPSDLPQTLGISILEPNAMGKVVPLSLDSGVHVPTPTSDEKPRMLRHRLHFWPRTSTPLVLLTNRDDNAQAVFGRMRVYAGPESLPAAEFSGLASERLLAAYFDKPLFIENFGAPEVADAETGRSLRDWVTFYEGARRLIEYLKYVGYNGAVISVARQGSTLYPSSILTPTPKYDTGTFFSTGQDPLQKDVLEMLFRMFDREGLKLIPAVQFSSTLASLEAVFQQDNKQNLNGVRLLEGDQRSWQEIFGTDHGMAPHYNPLDPQVQTAMRYALNELSDRYARHRSFHGLALQLDPESYAILPGEPWGQDPDTRRRFEESLRPMGLPNRERASGRDSDKPDLRVRDRQQAWLLWRAEQMADFHRILLDDLNQRHPAAQLLLLGGNMFTSPAVQPLLRPTLPNDPDVVEALLQLGLNVDHYSAENRIVFCRPNRFAAGSVLSAQSVNINLATSANVDIVFNRLQPSASLFHHETQAMPLPSFDAVSPFGRENTRTVLFAHIAESEKYNRQRFIHQLAIRDVSCLLDGGWVLPLGQEESVRPLFDVLRRLPAKPFASLQPKASGFPSQPLVVRSLIHQGRMYVYVVNDSPWQLTAEVDIVSDQPCKLTDLVSNKACLLRQVDGQLTWDLELQPFDIVAAVLDTDQATVDTWRVTVDRNSYAVLRQQVSELTARAGVLARANRLNVLSNPSFEAAPDRIPGWICEQAQQISIGPTNTEHFDGKQSLRIFSDSQKPAWVRSDPFPPPATGRIAVMVRLKTRDPLKQPPLRLAIEGRRRDGSSYYRVFNVTQNPRDQLLSDNWGEKPIVMPIGDLPSQELVDIRVCFDLMGPGEVWIDDVQVYDRWFPKNERDELMITSGLAARMLSMGQIGDCQRVLAGYWPRFLQEHVDLSETRMAALPANQPAQGANAPTANGQPADNSSKPNADAEKPSVLDKMKSLPNRLLPSRLR